MQLKPKSAQAVRWIKNLSDIYINEKGSEDIWVLPENRYAYLSYFLPLNLLRLKAVISEAQRLSFFHKLSHIVDIGSGPCATQLAFSDFPRLSLDFYGVEPAGEAQTLGQKLSNKLNLTPQRFISEAGCKDHLNESSLLVFSYSLNEFSNPPIELMKKSEAILILEPSTQVYGRKLQELRSTLIKEGFYIWAPCTHQGGCPLLLHSKKDWCHNRIHIELPTMLQENENLLPMKNRTLTYSYLLARKTATPHTKSKTRVIGDTMKEKGKTKQAICRSEEREFLSWLKKNKNFFFYERGSILEKIPDHELKGDELRVKN